MRLALAALLVCLACPAARADAPAASGLDKPLLRRSVSKGRDQVRRCYERALELTPGLAGTLRVDFVIGPDGAVLSATASGMDDAGLIACITKVFLGLRFPRPGGGGKVNVSFPFSFREDAGPPPAVPTVSTDADGPMDVTVAPRPPAAPTPSPHHYAAVLREASPRVRACYERALVKQPALAGQIKVRLTIGKRGRVSKVTVDGLGDKAMDRCVALVIRKLVFPAPEGGRQSVVFPYELSPPAPPPAP
jgi:outer membrane biosynthesis protein TonB